MRHRSLSISAGLALSCLLASLAVPIQSHAGKELTASPYEVYVDSTGNGLAFATDAPDSELLHFKARVSLPNGETFEQTSKSGYIEWTASPDLPNATVSYEAWVVTVEPDAPMRQDAPTPGLPRTSEKQQRSDADAVHPAGSVKKLEPAREYYADEFKQISRKSGAAELHNGSVSLTAPSVEDANRPEGRPLSALDGDTNKLERLAGTVLSWMVSPAKAQQVFNDDVESESTDPDFILDNTNADVDWFINQYNGGDFSIRDDGLDDIIYLETGGPDNALYVDSIGDVGLRTSTPARTLHLSEVAPVIRLEDTGDDQSWDILNTNATRFEIDATTTFTADCDGDGTDENCTPKPFTIEPATTAAQAETQDQALYITADGDIGIQTEDPRSPLEVGGSFPGVTMENAGIEWRVSAFSDPAWGIRNVTNGEAPFAIDGDAPASALWVAGNGVGVGTSSPVKQLHVQGSDASQLAANNVMARVENTTGTTESRRMLELVNNGSPLLVYRNTNSGETWSQNPVGGDFTITKSGTGQQEFQMDGGGNVTIQGSLTENSTRASKDGFAPVDANTVLAKLDRLSIEEWNYKHTPGARHVGPMAEEFHATFGLGPKDGIAPRDLAGVALAAAKALKSENESLKSDNRELRARLERIEKKLGLSKE